MLIAGVGILVTLILTAAVSYELFKEEVFLNLKNYAYMVKAFGLDIDAVYELDSDRSIRVSVIDENGDVIYDSAADVSSMENHLERPEVVQALESGEGYATRLSTTMSKNNFYYALLLDDGSVLRISEQTDSIYWILSRTLPLLAVIVVVLFVACALVTRILVHAFIAPIKKIAADLEHAEQIDTYPELRPFVNKIQKQHEDILKSADMRQEFTANVSHELKTPLTSISGYSELIASGMAGEKDITRFAREIHRNANRLLALIDDIIRLSELDVLNQAPDLTDVDLYQVARSCAQMLEINAKKHGVTLDVNGSHIHSQLNRDMMEELVLNLCDNAIRYNNPGGSVTVSVNEEDGHQVLSVSDTGIGIPKEHQERIFERFYRVDKSRSKSSGGTGLGLAIVKHIVSVHGARLEVKSAPKKGTKISVIFPQNT